MSAAEVRGRGRHVPVDERGDRRRGDHGVALGLELRRRGADPVVFEAVDEPGGVIRTRRVDGRVLDLGPQRTRLTPALADLIETAGIADEVLEAPDRPLFVYHDGRLRRVPTTVRGAVSTDLLSLRGKLRALGEPLAAPPVDGETVHEFFERAFGPEVARRIADPLYAGLYASDPDAMPVEHSLSRAWARLGVGDSVLLSALRSRLAGRSPPPVVSFDAGMATLPVALADRLGDDVRLGTPVEAIRETRAGYDLVSADGTEPVDRVVLTVPAREAARLLSGVDPASARGLSRLSYNPMAVVHLHVVAPLSGAGYQVPLDAGFVTRGVTWNASLFDRDGVYTAFLGGATHPGAIGWSDRRLGEVAAAEFAAVTGHEASPIAVHRLSPGMPAYDDTWAHLDGVSPPPGIHLCANYESRAGIPGRVSRAIDLADALVGHPGGDPGGSSPTDRAADRSGERVSAPRS